MSYSNSAPLPTINAPPAPPRLFGRQRHARTLQARLSEARLVTLTGAGGSGKTHLALHVIHTLAARFPGGVWWCDLGPVADPAFVPYAVATAFGMADATESLAALMARIGPLPQVLVLDGCEHLITAVAGLVEGLLRGCAGLRILATSLQPLGVAGEVVYPLPPLPLPPDDLPLAQLAAHPAIALFTARATAVNPSFRLTPEHAPLIISICRRLDGLPLAIELAAARAGLLSLEQIDRYLATSLAVLDNQPARGSAARQRALGATLTWGYSLLTTAEQRLFRSLAVFPGSFTLEAAAAIASESESDTITLLAGLVRKSMVVVTELPARGSARYRLLEPVRLFAREQLDNAGETALTRDRHLAWAIALAEGASTQPLGPITGAAMARLAAEYDNLRAALRWAITTRQVVVGLRFVVALFRFWFNRGPLGEARHWADEVLHLPEITLAPPLLRAQAAFVAGRLACRQGDDQSAHIRGHESLHLAQEAGDRETEARALDLLGLVSHDLNHFAEAVTYHQAALALRRELGDDYGVAVSLNNLGLVHFDYADYDAATACFTAALEAATRVGMSLLPALHNLAEIALARDDSEMAATYARRLLALAEATGDQHAGATATSTLAVVAYVTGALSEAARLGEQALTMLRQLDAPIWEADILRMLGDLALTEGNVAAAKTRYAEGLAAYERANSIRGRGIMLARLALLATQQSETEVALAYAREAVGILTPTGHRHPLIEAVEAVAIALATTEPSITAALLSSTSTERDRLRIPRLPPWRDPVEAVAARAAVAAPVSLDVAAALALGHATSPAAPQHDQVPELHASALGPIRVIVAGQPVPASAWTYRKACELFFYLLDRSPATKAAIGLDLWPDASPAQLRNYLHRSLHFIRHALGNAERIRFANGTYAINRALPLWYDVAHFEQCLREANALGPVTSLTARQRSRAIALLTEATALWRGEFLADLDAGGWAALRREELRITFVQALLDLGQLYALEAHYEQATVIYRRALAEDPYLEQAHREIMRCLARQGKRAQALRQYHALVELLATDLQTTPTPETTLLAERIRHGDDV
ncbi:MAG: tetratricopeptide repeat protein [Chloroflexus sp.]|nr:tetratricopeptide repeat protein [Chloroflexus sp.]